MSDEKQLNIVNRNYSFSCSASAQTEASLNTHMLSQPTNITLKNNCNNSLLAPPEIKPRKYSLPLINPNQLSPNEYLESYSRDVRKSFPTTILDSIDFSTQKHRLSQVGIAVSHHLSQTIGLNLLKSNSNHSDIVKQSKCLCFRYIRFKLRKRNLTNKRINFQRIKGLCNIRLDSNTSSIANELKHLILELERNYPKLYSSVLKNISAQSFKSLNEVQSILQLISQELFRNDITWARIGALYSITGALAVDSVQTGHSEYIIPIIETFTAFMDRDIAGWIEQQGGWDSLTFGFMKDDYYKSNIKYMLLSISLLFWAFLAYCLI